MFIAVATHKKINFDLPAGYHPVQVNSAINEKWPNYCHDADGESISAKNSSYSELTAMYWLWKNVSADIKGLCHYRRFFSNNKYVTSSEIDYVDGKDVSGNILHEDDVKALMADCDIILIRPWHPYPLTETEDLKIWCYEKDINALREVIYEYQPDYAEAYESVMSSKNISHYNMFIAREKTFNDYSQWLFDVLAKVEERTNVESYDPQRKRLYGYLSEVLLNVYIEKHNLKPKYVKVLQPFEFAGIDDCKIPKCIKREKIQEFMIDHHLYWLFEAACACLMNRKYRQFKGMRAKMKQGA